MVVVAYFGSLPKSGVMDACKTNVRVSLFRADLRARFVSGHDFSRAAKAANERALAPAALLSSQFGLRAALGQRNLPAGH
jgi:hypothetical protein